MRQLFKVLTSSTWVLLGVVLAAQPASAQKRYPSIEDKWDGTDYRAVVERVRKDGLELPTLADETTKPVFERMSSLDNIPLHMGLNGKLSVTIRYQRLDSALDPIHKIVVLYSNEVKKGKPYAKELANMMVYETKVSAALLDLSERYLATYESDKRYQTHVAYIDQMKNNGRQLYSELVQNIGDTRQYSKPDTLMMIKCALDGLSSYLPLFADEDRQNHIQKLTQQLSATKDQELKKALTELRDAIEQRRVKT